MEFINNWCFSKVVLTQEQDWDLDETPLPPEYINFAFNIDNLVGYYPGEGDNTVIRLNNGDGYVLNEEFYGFDSRFRMYIKTGH
jgi:hypothetical protein